MTPTDREPLGAPLQKREQAGGTRLQGQDSLICQAHSQLSTASHGSGRTKVRAGRGLEPDAQQQARPLGYTEKLRQATVPFAVVLALAISSPYVATAWRADGAAAHSVHGRRAHRPGGGHRALVAVAAARQQRPLLEVPAKLVGLLRCLPVMVLLLVQAPLRRQSHVYPQRDSCAARQSAHAAVVASVEGAPLALARFGGGLRVQRGEAPVATLEQPAQHGNTLPRDARQHHHATQGAAADVDAHGDGQALAGLVLDRRSLGEPQRCVGSGGGARRQSHGT